MTNQLNRDAVPEGVLRMTFDLGSLIVLWNNIEMKARQILRHSADGEWPLIIATANLQGQALTSAILSYGHVADDRKVGDELIYLSELMDVLALHRNLYAHCMMGVIPDTGGAQGLVLEERNRKGFRSAQHKVTDKELYTTVCDLVRCLNYIDDILSLIPVEGGFAPRSVSRPALPKKLKVDRTLVTRAKPQTPK